jgi:hypothetical protein
MARTGEAHTGAAHKVASAILRFGEFCSAVIVLGILSRFCYLISIAQVDADGRIIYAMVVAGISMVYSFFFVCQLNFSFWVSRLTLYCS